MPSVVWASDRSQFEAFGFADQDVVQNDGREIGEQGKEAVHGHRALSRRLGSGRGRRVRGLGNMNIQFCPTAAAINLKRLAAAFYARFPASGMIRMGDKLVSAVSARPAGRICLTPPGGPPTGRHRAGQPGNRRGPRNLTASFSFHAMR